MKKRTVIKDLKLNNNTEQNRSLLKIKMKILNETTSFCNECGSKECCPENECVLYRIEQIVDKIKN